MYLRLLFGIFAGIWGVVATVAPLQKFNNDRPTNTSNFPLFQASFYTRPTRFPRQAHLRSIAMPCQLLAWLRHRVRPPAYARTHAPVPSHPQNHPGPPSYDDLFPYHPDGTEDLETIRARHPPKRPLRAPIPTDSPTEAAYLASVTALIGLAAAVQDETDTYMIIARTAQAISIAASASPSHTTFLAALNSIELNALLDYDERCGRVVIGNDSGQQLFMNLIDTAARRALADIPPSNSFDPHQDLQSFGLVPPNMTPANRALLETVILNPHLFGPSQR